MNDDSRLSFERLEDRVLLSAPTAMLPATFAIMGSTAFVIGTSGDDYFEVDLHQRTVRENGAIHAIPVGVTDVQLDGLGGDDFFGLFSAAGSESVRILPGACLLESSGAGLTATAVSMETIVYLGHGYRGLNGDNRVVFIDSAGDDVFTGRAVRSQMAGAGFLNVAHAVDEAVAIANRGGVDLANLFDSAGSDLFVARPGVATLNGSLFRQQSQGFETVAAFGGTDAANDEARLFDTSDNDLFTASPASASLMGPGLDVRAYGFDSINAIASTGNDRAVLLDAPGDGQIELAHLNGVIGYIFEGVDGRDIAGTAVSSAGDMNGDGVDDLLIGAPIQQESGFPDDPPGEAYLVFGGSSLTNQDAADGSRDGRVELVRIDGTNGYVLQGADPGDRFGDSVAGVGDVNGDGFDDLLIGAWRKSKAYLVFGGDSNLAVVDSADGAVDGRVDVAHLSGTNGFTFLGGERAFGLGRDVSAAGDVNGDGFDDLLMLTDFNSIAARSYAAAGFVVFGGLQRLQRLDELDAQSDGCIGLAAYTDLPSGTGFTLRRFGIYGTGVGFPISSLDGISIGSAGDVNGDGFADVIGGGGTVQPGEAYLVFGGEREGHIDVDLSLNGNSGYRFLGIRNGFYSYDRAGKSVDGVGDVNGDGFDDLLVGADTPYGGEAYLVFGGSTNLQALDLADGTADGDIHFSELDGTNGFAIIASDNGDRLGLAVSGIDDVNGDGVPDVLLGADAADPGDPARNAAGESYILFGGVTNFQKLDAADGASDGKVHLEQLSRVSGWLLNGIDPDDRAGNEVAAAGDVNGDGVGDFLIGARNADPGSPPRDRAGESYLVFGGARILAFLDGSPIWNDLFVGRLTASLLTGQGFANQAINFDHVTARSRAGIDIARLFGTDGDDSLIASPTDSAMSGTGFEYRADGFARVVGTGGGGNDLVRLYDSVAADTFVANPTFAQLTGPGFDLQAGGFEQMIAVANSGGNDIATLYDSSGDDAFIGYASVGQIVGLDYFERAIGFDTVQIVGTAGGSNQLNIFPLNYQLRQLGAWHL